MKGRTFLLGLFLGCTLWSATGNKTAPLRRGWAAAPGQEERGPSDAESKRELYYKIINFALLVVGLGFVLRKPMAEFFTQRSEDIRKALDEGRSALEKSQAKLSAVEERLKHLEEEIGAFRASAEKEMQAERRRLAEETAREAEKILETARARMDSATRAAKLELKAFTARQSLQLAEQMIRARLDEAGRARLVSQFIATLGTGEKRN